MGDEKPASGGSKLLRRLRWAVMASAASAGVSGLFVTDTGAQLSSSAVRELADLLFSIDLPGSGGGGEPPAPPGPVSAQQPARERNLQAMYRWESAEYAEGDQVPGLGRFNMIVPTGDGSGLTSSAANPAEANFSVAPIHRDAIVDVELTLPAWTGQRITLLSADAELAAVVFSGRDVVFGDLRENYRSAGCTGKKDSVSLTLTAGKARLWCNGRFVGIQDVRNLPLSGIRVSGLVRKRDYLYSVVASLGR